MEPTLTQNANIQRNECFLELGIDLSAFGEIGHQNLGLHTVLGLYFVGYLV